MKIMKRSDIHPMPQYFDKYINLVEDVSIIEALENSLKDIKELDIEELENIGDYKYAIDKWTVKDILQHIVDVERILSYRALLIARNDSTLTPGFDEKYISVHSNANNRRLSSIIEELIIVRKSTIALFSSFNGGVLLRKGINWKYEMNVLAFGFCLVGHQSWHFAIIREKYLEQACV